MPADAKILDELERLRREIAALQTPAAAGAATDHAHELLDTVRTLITDAEATVREHPAATVAGAFAAGVLVGRLLGKG